MILAFIFLLNGHKKNPQKEPQIHHLWLRRHNLNLPVKLLPGPTQSSMAQRLRALMKRCSSAFSFWFFWVFFFWMGGGGCGGGGVQAHLLAVCALDTKN